MTSTSTFELACTGAGGTASASATVTVTPPAPTVSLAVSPTSVTSGGAATLTWSSNNAASCVASGAWTGAKTIFGSQSSGALTST
ncbi:MAG TPA: hypothetical protein VK635_10940, partial [Bradyrhizobium sp.]|nr:hypothetical protein [Bradyrhizobium sp.]